MIETSLHLARDGFTLDASFKTDGHITGLFGPSGAGKSTIIALMAGLARPERGKVIVDGRTLFDDATPINVPVHKRRVGVVFQEHRLFPHLTVRGNLQYGAPPDAAAEFAATVNMLELGPLLECRPEELSGGEKQRVALGRALASRPALLLLDEPLASLDVRLKRQILPYLKRIRDASKIPMLYVSHDLGEILQLTDRLIVLDRGKVAGQGRYTDLVHEAPAFAVVHDRGMQNVLSAVIVQHDSGEGLTIVRPEGAADPACHFAIPKIEGSPGAAVSIAIHPWDIALAAAPVEAVSIQNQIRGVVTRCTLHDRGAIVEVDIGVPLLVEVSRRSASAMGLAPGRPIVCLIKSHAIRPG